MIASGSIIPGIDPAAFGLPAGTALRYERPAPALRRLFPSYAVLDSDPAIWTGPDSWVLPGWAQIWVVLTDGAITVDVRNHRYAPLGAAILFGGTSQAMPVTSRGGVTVVIDVSPIGWARLFDVSALGFRDRITPLDQLFPAAPIAELIALLGACFDAAGIGGVLDDFLLRHLPAPHRDEEMIERINDHLSRTEMIESGVAASGLGLSPRGLLALSTRYLGYGPKVVMRRARFLRALSAMLIASGPPDFSVAPPGYHDVPHFLRDGNLFLGLTPRRFLALPMPYLRAVMRARTMVIGAPLPLLDQPTSAAA